MDIETKWLLSSDLASTNPYLSEGEMTLDERANLDPIDHGGVGKVNVRAMAKAAQQRGFAFIVFALQLLFVPVIFQSIVLARSIESSEMVRSPNCLASKVADLITWGILGEVQHQRIEAWCRLFTVPKANGLRRLIFDGRKGNKMLKKPPRFRLFTVEELLQTLGSMGEEFYAVVGDIRHHFYGVPITSEMARFYGVRLGKQTLVPRVLPMGSSWAPISAQSVSVMLCAFKESGEDDLGIPMLDSSVPSHIVLKKNGGTVGHVFICIDNIAVISEDRELVDKWEKRLERNVRHLGAVWKEKTRCSSQDFLFLGIQWSNGKWRLDPSRTQRWLNWGVTKSSKLIDVQRLLGVCLWAARVFQVPLFELESELTVLRMLLKDPVRTLLEQEVFLLNASLERVIRNQWKSASECMAMRLYKEKVVVACDASKDTWAWVQLEDGAATASCKGACDPTQHIYFKELHAIAEALHAVQKTGVEVIVLCDNLSVVHTLRKWHGKVAPVPILRELHTLCETRGWRLTLKWVESEGNAANPLTRDRQLDSGRNQRSWLVAVEDNCNVVEEQDAENRGRWGDILPVGDDFKNEGWEEEHQG